MADQINNYQCPACTGPLHFVGSTGKLQCDYCGSVYEVAEIEAMYAKEEEEAAEAKAAAEEKREQQGGVDQEEANLHGWSAEEAASLRAYNCPSCGAELICDVSTAATSCPYCGNPTVVPGQFKGDLKPDYVIPFKLDPEKAKTGLKNHYKGKIFLPSAFSKENKIQELKGVYVPFWLFDGSADADVQFDATESRSYTQGDYRVTETKHFKVHRAGNVAFAMIPVDASSKMPDNHMDSIEPFDYKELKPFSTAYLPGYLADKFDVSIQDSKPRVSERATNTAVQAMQDDISHYDTITITGKRVQLHPGKVFYAMLPVYMLSTKWHDKNYLFAMNGQTGRLIGDLPVDWAKYWGMFAGITVGAALIIATILTLFLG